MPIRLRWIAEVVALGAALACLFGPAAADGARTSGRIVFYAGVASSVPGTAYDRNTPEVRPKVVYMFADGSWVIGKLRWSTWGRSIARARGISSASDCKPNCAQGKRTNHPAQLSLSAPKRLFGRTVYTCFKLTVPAAPASDQDACLKRQRGNQYTYSPVAGSPSHLADFLSPDGKTWCVLNQTVAFCGFGGPPSNTPGVEYSAELHPSGKVVTCAWQPGQNPMAACLQNWDSSATRLKAGQVDTLYDFRCRVTVSAITCKVDTGAGKGKGFTISQTGVTT